MARGSNPSKSGPSRFRLIVLEAEVADGDISQIASAIQNALRPSQVSPASRQIVSKGSSSEPAELVDLQGVGDDDLDLTDIAEVVKKTRPTRPRAIKPPRVLDDIDFTKAPSLVDYVESYELKTDFERYLAIALWFREHRATPAVTAGHIYTSYRHLGWSTSIPDFTKPLRNMKGNQLFTGGVKEGFAINQLGEGKLKAKKRG